MSAEKRPDPERRHLEARLSEAGALLSAAEARSEIDTVKGVVIAGVLDLVPGAGGAVQELLRGRDGRVQNVVEAARRLLDAIATVHDAVLERLETDPRFADFLERVVLEGIRAEQREKIDYYGRLVCNAVSPSGPDEDERVRLLDALDALRLHHLRLFAALADTQDIDATIDQGELDVWHIVEIASGLTRGAAQQDWQVLQQIQLSTGTPTVPNLRLMLTEFGLSFERFVLDEDPRPCERWRAQVEGDAGAMLSLAIDFARPSRDPRIIREIGGYYVVSNDWEGLSDRDQVRLLASAFLDRVASGRRLSGDLELAHLVVGRLWEARQGRVKAHLPPSRSDASTPPDDSWPTPPLAPFVERQLATDPVVSDAIAGLEAGTWAGFVQCVAAVESVLGHPTAYPGISVGEMRRFNGQARAEGLDRPSSGEPVAMSLDQARGRLRNLGRALVYVNAQVWSREAR